VEPALTASAIPIGGANITEAFGRVDAITPSAIPIGGATIADAFGRIDAITPSAIPIGGATIADSYGIVDAITPSAIPIDGSTITEGTTGAYADSISPSSIPITGATISVTATWLDAITASAIPIDGATITDSLVSGVVDYSDTLTPASLPIEGSNVVSLFEPTVVEPEALAPGHSAGVTVAYRRRWYEYVQGRKRRGTWRPGEGTLEDILRGVYEAEDASQAPLFDIAAAREGLEAARESARELEAGRQREAILQALMASQMALEQRMLGAVEQRRQAEVQAQAQFQAVQEAVMAAALEWERREQDDLEVLLLCA
jgi:hypothetical protein